MRRELSRFEGEEVKFTGDGCLALFDSPEAAVDCAAALASGVAALGLEIRAGLHTATVELRDHDVAGMAVNVAARVLGRAGPSQVVVTRTVKDVLAGSGRTFAALGTHELKGVPDAWELYVLGGSERA